METLQFQNRRAQASLEFIIVLSIVLTLTTVFVLTIIDEYTDTFVVSSVKTAAEYEISQVVLAKAGCANTSLVAMNFSKSDGKIKLNVSGCTIDLAKVAGAVEVKMCGAKTPSGTTITCSGKTYTIESA